MRKLTVVIFASALALGCTSAGPSSDIALTENETGVTGQWEDVVFSSEYVDTNVLEIVIELNDMVVTAVLDLENGVFEYDGFGLADGSDTQMREADRERLAELSRALEDLGVEVSEPLAKLRTFVSVWSEFPTSLELQRIAVAEADRSYSSICWANNSYQQVTHDGVDGWSSRDRWDDKTTINAYISMHAPGSCSDGTYFLNNGWQCFEPDHSSSIEYAYGNCFGRCGAGCGSSSQLTWDCADHDECVRFGHSTASFWCDDEFTTTIDDWASAPNCL